MQRLPRRSARWNVWLHAKHLRQRSTARLHRYQDLDPATYLARTSPALTAAQQSIARARPHSSARARPAPSRARVALVRAPSQARASFRARAADASAGTCTSGAPDCPRIDRGVRRRSACPSSPGTWSPARATASPGSECTRRISFLCSSFSYHPLPFGAHATLRTPRPDARRSGKAVAGGSCGAT